MIYDMAVKNGLVWLNSQFVKTNLYIRGEKIVRIDSSDLAANKTLDAAGKKVIPGIIDPHVHFELDLGKFISADDFESGSKTGLYGGVTTYIDFLDPVSKGDEVESAFEKRLKLARKSASDYSFHVTAANPVGETKPIADKALELGLPSIKIFTAYSESGRRTYEPEISEFLKLSHELDFLLLVHAEDEDFIKSDPVAGFSKLSVCRPPEAEISQIKKMAGLVSEYKGRLYIVHTNCGESVFWLKDQFPELLHKHLYLESCPQYFHLNDSVYHLNDGYSYVLAPPLRPEEQKQELIRRFEEIDSIGTDHCPFLLKEKNQPELNKTPFGIGGIEYSFPLMYSLFGESVIDKMTKAPAEIYNLAPRKGVLTEGSDADFFIFDDSRAVPVKENHSRCDYNIYENRIVAGRVETTVLRGNIVMDKGRLMPVDGQFLTRRTGNENN